MQENKLWVEMSNPVFFCQRCGRPYHIEDGGTINFDIGPVFVGVEPGENEKDGLSDTCFTEMRVCEACYLEPVEMMTKFAEEFYKWWNGPRPEFLPEL